MIITGGGGSPITLLPLVNAVVLWEEGRIGRHDITMDGWMDDGDSYPQHAPLPAATYKCVYLPHGSDVDVYHGNGWRS